MKIIVRSAFLLFALPLAGCSYFSSASTMQAQDKNYLSARSAPPLKIPPGISSSTFENEYPVSDKSFPLSELRIDPTPPGL